MSAFSVHATQLLIGFHVGDNAASVKLRADGAEDQDIHCSWHIFRIIRAGMLSRVLTTRRSADMLKYLLPKRR